MYIIIYNTLSRTILHVIRLNVTEKQNVTELVINLLFHTNHTTIQTKHGNDETGC